MNPTLNLKCLSSSSPHYNFSTKRASYLKYHAPFFHCYTKKNPIKIVLDFFLPFCKKKVIEYIDILYIYKIIVICGICAKQTELQLRLKKKNKKNILPTSPSFFFS
ncbi:hypothetical protein GDO78_019910 [Eleutherodactylus coqui]|uniref:Uncharacterized protein n=1 Tax=Eleutherodactylus coqui TaxID=57060 RepID=A0A8J6BBW4_ELECQ|nr:hypothetical protein GDO78_019910 [Eleutherodactylus coqui]